MKSTKRSPFKKIKQYQISLLHALFLFQEIDILNLHKVCFQYTFSYNVFLIFFYIFNVSSIHKLKDIETNQVHDLKREMPLVS